MLRPINLQGGMRKIKLWAHAIFKSMCSGDLGLNLGFPHVKVIDLGEKIEYNFIKSLPYMCCSTHPNFKGIDGP